MVEEHVRPGYWDAVYDRFHREGRLLPHGLHYLNSWPNAERGICYQLMETGDPGLFEEWTERWSDLVRFEIVPID